MNTESSFDWTSVITRGGPVGIAVMVLLIVLSLLLSLLMIAVHALGPMLFFTGVGWWLIWLRRTVPTRGGRQGL